MKIDFSPSYLGNEEKIRKFMQDRSLPAKFFVEKYGLNRNTVSKWRNRQDIKNRPPTNKRIKKISEKQEKLIAKYIKKGFKNPNFTIKSAISALRQIFFLFNKSSLYRILKKYDLCHFYLRPIPSPEIESFKGVSVLESEKKPCMEGKYIKLKSPKGLVLSYVKRYFSFLFRLKNEREDLQQVINIVAWLIEDLDYKKATKLISRELYRFCKTLCYQKQKKGGFIRRIIIGRNSDIFQMSVNKR